MFSTFIFFESNLIQLFIWTKWANSICVFLRNIITCGADGYYRVWKGYEDNDPERVRVGDEATAISFKVTHCLTISFKTITFS